MFVAKILIVDDQLGVRRLLFETFKEDQHTVEMAVDGIDALKILQSFQPDLILMDIKMPGMNGMDTLRRIRAADKDVNVIMMTAYGDSQNAVQAKELNVIHYMSKPFDLFELREIVNELFRKND
ncbi:MAG TPA: response regulator [Desulfitobacteriaceae bacterium]|jgi:two-component system response regulator (stage 0 sporulation protein F)|nr:response regulator [Desulfitobacteriaceae bacterium]